MTSGVNTLLQSEIIYAEKGLLIYDNCFKKTFFKRKQKKTNLANISLNYSTK